MAETRTWLTTPVGSTPLDDEEGHEHWVPGPRLPVEPRPPFRYRGAVGLFLTLAVVVGLTFGLAPVFLDVQDPTFDGGSDRLDDDGSDPTFERPTSN